MTPAEPTPPPRLPPEPELVALLNAHRGGFELALGLTFTRASTERIGCEVTVGPHLTQPYGIVHGGVYASIVESLGSVGATLAASARGQHAVGLDNQTSFLRAVRAGKLVATGTPVHRGRTTQLWQVEVRDEQGALVATGRLRALCLDPGSSLAGETVAVKATTR